MVSLKGFRDYAHLDCDFCGDDTAELCLRAAKEKAREGGIDVEAREAENSAAFELYVYALALHEYENRGFETAAQSYSTLEYTEREMQKARVGLMEIGL